MKPTRHKIRPTGHQLAAEQYCRQHGIDVDIHNDHNGHMNWSVWISYPDGLDRVFVKETTELNAWIKYWKACVVSADVWYRVLQERQSIPLPPISKKTAVIPPPPIPVPPIPL